ncbi:MAG: endonuclease domain-containing protein [Candidatus Peregrinibacteria bacterium]
MKEYQSFIFDSYGFDPATNTIELNYCLDTDIRFTEKLILPENVKVQGISKTLDAALRALHIIGGISYFKTCLPKKIAFCTGTLTDDQAKFWNTVYEKGLGEFFYRNNIDFRDLINFPHEEQTANSKQQTSSDPQSPIPNPQSRVLVPLGGGKDSTVTLEMLKKAGAEATLLRVGHHPLITATAKVAGLPLLTVERRIDPLLFKLNAEGALNGHIPITAYLSFLTVVLAELYGFDAIAMSDERSANIGNVDFHGMKINHQWSKSLEFERMFREYVKTFISPDIDYFSLLRPFSELSIAKQFSKLPQYFPCTTSCNKNWKIQATSKKIQDGRWCCDCPKCAFVFALFAAFLPKKTLVQIFGKNLFDDTSLLPLYRELLGIKGFKPFECVGTPDETSAAFLLAHERGDLDDTIVMQLFRNEVLPKIKDGKKLIDEAMKPSAEHSIPVQFQKMVSFL